MNREAIAEQAHNIYLEECERLGWEVRPENKVPYAELSPKAQALDLAFADLAISMQDKLRFIINIYEEALKQIAEDQIEWQSQEIAQKALEKGKAK